MRIVVDTNCMLVSISRNSKYNWLFQALVDKEFDLCISNEIVNEYEEIIEKFFSKETVEPFYELLTTASNVKKIDVSFRLNLIQNDPDDNKFVDCAFAANVDFIVTNDADYKILSTIDFPKFNVVSLNQFHEILNK